MKRILLLLLLIAGSAMSAFGNCNTTTCGAMVGNTPYPYSEVIANDPLTIPGDGNWHIIPPCVANSLPSYKNIRATGPFDLSMRGSLRFSTTGVAVGARYEVQFILLNSSGQEYEGGWYAKVIRSIQAGGTTGPPDSSRSNTHQGDFLHGAATNMAAGDYTFYAKVRLFGGGSMNFEGIWLHAEGAPTTYGGGRYGKAITQTIGSSWVKAVELPGPGPGDALLPNNSGALADYALQGYIEIASGTPGDQLAVGFSYDGLSSGTHWQNVYVPNELPAGIHVRDILPNQIFAGMPTGSGHTLAMYIKNQSGGTTTISNAELQAVGFKPEYLAGTNYTYADDVKTVYTNTAEAQPAACVMIEQPGIPGQPVAPCAPNPNQCGLWTKLLSLTPTPLVAGEDQLPMPEAYVEFLGHSDVWNNSSVEIGFEIVYPGQNVDFEIGVAEFDMQTGKAHISFSGDARNINVQGATINLWIRKLTCYSSNHEVTSFQVGKRWLGLRSAPTPFPYCAE